VNFTKEYFNCIGLIYAHFPDNVRAKYHNILNKYLQKGGIIILEAFSKSHIKFNSVNEKAGGPKDLSMLFSIEEIKKEFNNYEIIELKEEIIELNEGLYHIGKSSVIRFVGKKK